jgi:nucleoside-diphosphate-sugar epimerase
MRVLIVGCGYVGLPLGAALAALGHEVFGLRRAPWGPALPGITPLAADITRPEELARLPAAYDWVVHCVSSSGGGTGEYRSIYLQGTRNLLAWLAARPPGKLVYTSSTAVYGQNDGSFVDESAPTQPLAETARVLVQAEQVLLEAARQSRFPALILRLAGIYGPGRSGRWFKDYLSGQARIEAAGGRILNLIHRDDVVGATLAALEKGRPGEIYNAVDDEPVTQLACFEWLAAALGGALPPASPGPAPSLGRGLTSKRVSNHKLKTSLSYTFKYPTFRQGYAACLSAAISTRAAMRAQRWAESEGE